MRYLPSRQVVRKEMRSAVVPGSGRMQVTASLVLQSLREMAGTKWLVSRSVA